MEIVTMIIFVSAGQDGVILVPIVREVIREQKYLYFEI